jgi:hypothetical protein
MLGDRHHATHLRACCCTNARSIAASISNRRDGFAGSGVLDWPR